MQAMNVVKCYAWEDSFLDRLMNVRRHELEWIKVLRLPQSFLRHNEQSSVVSVA